MKEEVWEEEEEEEEDMVKMGSMDNFHSLLGARLPLLESSRAEGLPATRGRGRGEVEEERGGRGEVEEERGGRGEEVGG